jgi:hypothetical protein
VNSQKLYQPDAPASGQTWPGLVATTAPPGAYYVPEWQRAKLNYK